MRGEGVSERFFVLIQHAKTILLVFLFLILLLVHAECLYYRISLQAYLMDILLPDTSS
jgi:hypothetical protein